MSTLVITEESGFEEFYWKNAKDVTISPKFPKRTLALEWFSMHEEWMKESDRDSFANLMYMKSNN